MNATSSLVELFYEPLSTQAALIANISLEGSFELFDLTNSTNGTYKPYSQRPETYIVPVVFLFIFISGVIGNVTLITVLIREQLIKTPSYLYILNLSLGDLAVILGTVPFVGTIYTFESWPYGEFVCKFSEFIRDVSIGVSVLTLSAMSIDRYRATFSTVMRPVANRGQVVSAGTILSSSTGLTMMAIWLVAMALAGPTAYFSFIWEVTIPNDRTIYVCYPFPADLGPFYPKTVVLVKCVLFYIVPLLIIACCYVSIALHLISKAKSGADIPSVSHDGNGLANGRAGVGATSFKRSQKKSQSRAKLILLLVLIFLVCFFPNHLFMIWFYFHPDSSSNYNDFWHVWRIASFCLTFLNSCLNPITLYLTSDQFKELFHKYLLHCCKPVATSRKNQLKSNLNSHRSPSMEMSSCSQLHRLADTTSTQITPTKCTSMLLEVRTDGCGYHVSL